MAGDGNYGGNGSIYWRNHSGPATSTGKDPVAVPAIGGNTGNFQLKLRYSTLSGKTIADLDTLLQAVGAAAEIARARLLSGASTDETIAIQVPAIARVAPPAPNTVLEVHVDW